MSRHLLDTHVVLFSLTEPDRLSRQANAVIEEGSVLLSVVSYWEVVLKSAKGKLEIGEPRGWWEDALNQLNATPLHLKPEHISRLWGLPALHSDPFDRILVAQALSENLTLISGDAGIHRYSSSGLRVIW